MDVRAIYDTLKSLYKFEFDLKDEQHSIISAILDGKDVSAILPTGYGKSVCYILPPLILDKMRPDERHTAIVVSPLISLMADQQKQLQERGIEACVFSHDREGSTIDIENDPVSVIFITPEVLQTTRFRKMLVSKRLRHRVCLLACDEAHCVSQWGESFRPEYREIASARSLVQVPFLALTATATEDIQQDIFNYLLLAEDTVSIAKIPNRPNIFLGVTQRCTGEYESELAWFKEYVLSAAHIKKTLIFCRSYNAVYNVWSWLTEAIDTDGIVRKVEMYHASTDEQTKERILSVYREKNSNIRVLVCTVAFGMGIDIPDIETVIHWGASSNPLAYWQEVGRAGRAGQQVYAVLYPYPRSLMKTITSAGMRDLVKADSCIRVHVLQYLKTKAMREKMPVSSRCEHNDCEVCACDMCLCCSVCQSRCECPGKRDFTQSVAF